MQFQGLSGTIPEWTLKTAEKWLAGYAFSGLSGTIQEGTLLVDCIQKTTIYSFES